MKIALLRVVNSVDAWLAAKTASPAETELAKQMAELFKDAVDKAVTLYEKTMDPTYLAACLNDPDIKLKLNKIINQPWIAARPSSLLGDKEFKASAHTLERAKGNLMDTLKAGMDEGLGIAAIARNLRKNFKDMADSELIRVARTEVNGVQQEANWQSHQQAQIAYLQWISSRDKRTRESHARMNGQIIPATGRFSNGLRYPGDRTGSIKEWINCRCRTAPFVMPLGKMAPAGKPYFYKQDLVSVPSSEFTQSFI